MSVAGGQTRKVDDASAGARYDVDVLVIGGGPAGTWAAISAAARGAKVVLADKGYCGTSGATAPAGTALWYVAPDGDARSRAKASRFAMGGALAEHAWMDRVQDERLTIEELQPMLAIEYGIRSRQSCKLMRVADEMKSVKVLHVSWMSLSGNGQER